MRAVNLLPRESRSHGRLRRVNPLLVGGAALTVVVVGALGAGFAISHSHAASERQRLASARAELARFQTQHPSSGGVPTPQLSQPAAIAQEGSWRVAVDTALVGRVAWDGVLADLGRVVPARVRISTVSLGATSAGATTGGTTPSSLMLGGNAYSQQDIARLLSRLQLVPRISQVTLTSSSAEGHSITFAISAQVAVTLPAAPAAPGGSA